MRLKTAAAWIFLGVFIVSGLAAVSSPANFNAPESILQDNSRQDLVGPTEHVASDIGTLSGIIDPVLVEQAGYIQSENISARTDTGVNTTYDLDIDASNNWVGSVAEVNVWDLKKLYLVNGTFDEGIPGSNQDPGGSVTNYPYGWDATSDDGGSGMTQFAEYVNQGQTFVATENQGQDLFGNSYRHHQDTYVVWYQTITNDPFTTDFTLNLDYLYYRGPIDKPGGDSVSGGVVMFVQFAGTTVWTQNLVSLDSRGIWYNTGDIPLTGMSVGTSFTFFVGIYFTGTMDLSAGDDYDNDGAADGIANAASISVQFDNIELSGQTEPDFEQVDLQFAADGTSVPITGTSGQGSASVENPSLWTSGPVPIEITSNDTVSFKYQTRLLSHRFINSSPTTDTGSEGVSYTIDANQDPSLNLFTYIGTVDPYEQFVVNIVFPPDWENVTVKDPFQNDVTSQCSVTSTSLSIPTSLVSRLGWWEVSFNSPNYALGIDTQVYNQVTTNWEDTLEFRTGNRTRITASIGTATVTPALDDDTQVNWMLPNDTLWSTDVVPSGVAGQISSSGRTFGPTNTSAGEWSVSIFWTNGTELAYGTVSFSLIHRAELVPVQVSLEVEVGVLFSNFMTYRDADNGELILDDVATITANWSTGQVVFTPDLFRNWYEADFDTNLIGGGTFLVEVDASRPYYEDVSTTFTVTARYTTTLEILNIGELPVERGLDESFPVHFRYEQNGGTGIAGATLDVSYTSTFTGLEEGTFQDYDNGSYTMYLKANTSDTYSITFAASKPYHIQAQDSFTIIVEEIATDLIRINGTADAIRFGDNYRLLLQYQNSSAVGLDGATVELVSATPSTGIDWTITPTGDLGVYEVFLEPEKADVFTLVFSASLLNHETQFTTFTLTVSEIATTLTATPPLATIAFDQNFTVTLLFQDEFFNPLSNATVEVVDLPPELAVTEVIDWDNGTYSLTLTPLDQGAFDLLIKMSLENYQTATEAISLFVNPIPTTVQLENGISSLTVDYNEPYSLLVYYNRTDLGTEVVDGNITITGAPEGVLVYSYEGYSGYYLLTIRGLEIGKWQIEINANRSGYRSGTELLLLEIAEIDTVVQGSLLGAILYGRSSYVNFSYLIEANGTRIRTANVTRLGEASDWVDFIELANGVYTIEIVPEDLGYHEVVLRFERYGFETRSFTLSFTVDPVPIEVVFLGSLSGLEGSTITFSVRVQEVGTNEPVSGALVFYTLVNPDGIALEDSVVMDERVSEPGVYSAALVIPPSGYEYTVSVTVDIDNYEIQDGDSVATVTSRTNFVILVIRTVNENLGLFLAAGVVGLVLAGTRVQTRRRRKTREEALAIKKRFDDARNILGIIVLHKESGLSVYSKILKAGIDESIIAAFITAIRNFRMEFDIENGSDLGQIVPISDIIRVITTENLVIAFIMLNRPSQEQRRDMLAFARKIGMVFDDEFKATPMEVMNPETVQALDNLFDEVMDGILLRNYKLRGVEKLPKDTQCISDLLNDTGADVFKLDYLAVALSTCGLDEAKAYTTVMDALENGLLEVTDEEIPTEEDLFIADVEALLVAAKTPDDGTSISEDDLGEAE